MLLVKIVTHPAAPRTTETSPIPTPTGASLLLNSAAIDERPIPTAIAP